MSARSSSSLSSTSAAAVSMGEYAPSPNTCSIALLRANQLRVQTLLRQLLTPATGGGGGASREANDAASQQQSIANNNRQRVDVLRVLRRTLRELDFELSWLTQVDFFETLERILRDDDASSSASPSAYLVPGDNWRLIDDATKLLIEAIPRFRFDIEHQTLANILASVVQNLGHQRSEVRRSSLLLINMYLQERPQEFQQFLRLFIEYGLANHRNEQAQRGAILSLPLLMSEQVVNGEDLQPLIRCLSELLVDSANSRLFYSLFLALQRLNLTIGDQRFAGYLSRCSPEATMLYRQAASRSNSLAVAHPQPATSHNRQPNNSSDNSARSDHLEEEPSKQVTFEADLQQQQQQQTLDKSRGSDARRMSTAAPIEPPSSEDTSQGSLIADIEDEAVQQPASEALESGCDSETSEQITQRPNDRQQQATSTASQQQARTRQRYYSSVSSTCSSEANLVDPSHYMSEAALSGRPLSGFEQIHHIDHSSTGLAINDMGICCTPTMELGPGAENELKFGIFPRHLVWVTLKQSARLNDRLDALHEIMCIVRDSPINHLAILMTYFDSFLEQFVGRLLEPGTDYKLELCAIDMIETIVIKTKLSTVQYVRPIVNLLARTIGDSRQVFRDNTVRVLHKMMAYLPPQHVIDALFEHKHHRQASVREECVNRVTAAVLEYDKQEFNLTKLCYHVLPMLADHHASVRLAALECIAALAHALGQERIGSLLTAAEAVQTGCDYDGLLDAIHARLLRRTLPRCHSDGSIGYVIKPFLNLANASFHQEHQAADVRWILEAPSSHQHVGDPHAIPSASGQQQHAHRPGVYSPPPADVHQRQEMRRRSSVTHLVHALSSSSSSNEPTGAVDDHKQQQHHRHHHHHHHHHHHPPSSHTAAAAASRNDNNQKPQRRETTTSSGGASASAAETTATTTAAAASEQAIASGSRKQSLANPSQNEATQRRHSSLAKPPATRTVTESEISNSANRKQRDEQQQQQAAKDDSQCSSSARQATQPITSSPSSISSRRGTAQSRQDSASSSDTNKVLFKYYLGKFKESLDREQSITVPSNGVTRKTVAGSNAVLLPSDSLIYTDTSQAYALSQHQTRQLQTSFDYDSDSVGQIPSGTSETSKRKQKKTSKQRKGKNAADFEQQQQQQSQMSRETTASEMAAAASSSGNESPQTVIEQKQQQQQQQRQSSQENRQGEESVQQQQQQQTGQSVAPRERRKSLAKQPRASEANVGHAPDADDDHDHDYEQVNVQQRGEPQAARPRSNSERLVRDTTERRSAPRPRQSTVPKKGGLTRQYASMVADYAPSDEEEQCSSSRASPAAIERQRDEESATGEASDEKRGSRARTTTRRSSHTPVDQQHQQQQQQSQSQGDHEAEVSNQQEQREIRRRASRSQPPSRHSTASSGSHHEIQAAMNAPLVIETGAAGAGHSTQPRRAVSVSPSLACSVNIRHILENVAEIEGPFQDPNLALKVSLEALEGPCWSTKVEGMLALIRLASYHQQEVLAHLHEIVSHTANETRNLRSTVARSAIFTLGDLCAKLKRSIEPELDLMVQSLLNKSIENTAFIRDDIRKAFSMMVDHLTQWRLANSLINHGANHKNVHVRRMASQFVAQLVDRMGAAKCLVGARDISSQLIPAVARFAQDNSPHTRYYGRLILLKIMHHGAFERLLRKNLSPNLYRSTIGIVESVKRRGAGDPPSEN